MSKPFNFEEFKAGKPALVDNIIIYFLAYDEGLTYPIVVKYKTSTGSYSLKFLQKNATMLPTKRTVWIAIAKRLNDGFIEPSGVFYKTKEEALEALKTYNKYWQVIDAIPYEIEE